MDEYALTRSTNQWHECSNNRKHTSKVRYEEDVQSSVSTADGLMKTQAGLWFA